MKKQLLLLAVALFATATAVRAQEPVQINSSNFPDSNFRDIVKGKDIDKNQDGWLATGELAAVTTLTARGKSIESLKGVEHFYKLTQLNCENNRLSSLDVSKITTLKALYCSQNRLTGLDVSKNTALTMLFCYENKLTSLDVSKNTELTALLCYDNQLTSLDLTNNKALTNLSCYINQIGHSDMLKLVNSLPTVTKGNFYGISISSIREKNVLAKSRVEIAKSKGWSVKAKDGSSNVDYEGSDDPGIIINATNFPDDKFRAIVAGTYIDKDADGYLSDEEIAAVTELNVFSQGFASLKGIEFFTALTQLDCSNNQLTSLDVSKNTALTLLNCSYNQLATLDVSKNTALEGLYCHENQLTSLDVSKNTALTELACFNNQIKEDKMLKLVNSLPTVTEGYFFVIDTKDSNEQNVCTRDQVAIATGKGWTVYDYDGGAPEVLGKIAIDATNFPDENFRAVVAGTSIDKDSDGYLSDEEIAAVTQLDVREMGIQNLKGIEFFTGLKELFCQNNELTSLDVSKNTELTRLACGQNQIKSLDLSKNTKMENLHCANNQLTALDVSMMPNLWRLFCLNNKLTKLDVTKNTKLTELNCGENQLTSLDVTKNTKLTELHCGDNQLTSLDVSKNTALNKLWCFDNQLTSLDVSKNTALTVLSCGENQLTALDVSKNTALENLYCDNNQLTSLDVSKNTALIALFCNDNQLTSLDVSKNAALVVLNCYNNQLSSIDLSKNTALQDLRCENNQLTSLDVSNNTALKFLVCFNNQIKEDQMQTLVNSLPTVTGGKFYVIDTTSSNEQNVCTKPQVKIATDKGWKVYDYNDGSQKEYAGSEPSAIGSIEVSAEEKDHWYSLDGKRLSGKPTKKGIYVRNGRKVVVK